MFITRFAAALLACVVLSACSPNFAHYSGKTDEGWPVFRVVFDEGGWIESYDTQVNHFNNTKTRVEIRGMCGSACTMYLGANDVCVHPTSELLFHGAIPVLPGETKAVGDNLMRDRYNPALQAWYDRHARHLQVVSRGLTGQELHDQFGYELCDT